MHPSAELLKRQDDGASGKLLANIDRKMIDARTGSSEPSTHVFLPQKKERRNNGGPGRSIVVLL
jgi:hypothetical protein